MAPISPTSFKRTTPEDDERLEVLSRKRGRTEERDEQADATSYRGIKVDLFEETPRQLLMRSVALALEHVGFHGATTEALEAMCSEADTYASELLAQITTSMLTARRPLPTPIDFQYGLSQFALSTSSLEPHLKPPINREHLNIWLEPPSPADESPKTLERLIGDELSGEPDKASKPYIPKHLPPFPSKHTYKFTEKESSRETDPKKIREEASQQARQGEEALRRLTTVGKVGKEKIVKLRAENEPKSKQRYQLWEQTMSESSTQTSSGTLASSATVPLEKEVERAVVVNSSSAYHRKGAGKRRGAPQLPVELLGKT